MRRLAVTAAVLGVLALAAPVAAVVHGTADGSRHPYVGGLVAAETYSDGTWIYCSGMLIAPKVFLTAAHCGKCGRHGHRERRQPRLAAALDEPGHR